MKMSNFILSLADLILFLPFLLTLPSILFVCGILATYKGIVSTIGKLAKRLKPLETAIDYFVTLDNFNEVDGKQPKVLGNVGWIFHVSGSIELNWLHEKFYNSILKNNHFPDSNFWRFYTYIVKFGGYNFRKSVKNIDLHSRIYEVEVSNHKELSCFLSEWFSSPYPKNQPLWEVILIRLRPTEELELDKNSTTVIAFKIHHSLADGYTLINLLDVLTGAKTPYLVKDDQTENWVDKMKLFTSIPRILLLMAIDVLKIRKANRLLPIDESGSSSGIFSTTSLKLADFQTIRKKTGVHFLSIFQTLLTGVVRRLLLDEIQNEKLLPDNTFSATPYGLSNHPFPKMANHWCMSHFKVPIKISSPLKRLLKIETEYFSDFQQNYQKILNQYIVPLLSLLPVSITKFLLKQDTGFQIGFTQLLGSMERENEYELNGFGIQNIFPLIGRMDTPFGIVGFGFTHGEQIDSSLHSIPLIAGSQEGIDKMLREYFVQELEILRRELELI